MLIPSNNTLNSYHFRAIIKTPVVCDLNLFGILFSLYYSCSFIAHLSSFHPQFSLCHFTSHLYIFVFHYLFCPFMAYIFFVLNYSWGPFITYAYIYNLIWLSYGSSTYFSFTIFGSFTAFSNII